MTGPQVSGPLQAPETEGGEQHRRLTNAKREERHPKPLSGKRKTNRSP
ncbi:MAG: hypothetical protein K6T66_09520 [Peptococcaceae bacterium]|nr:hypothetical protein [Peptococcaceae bacterium]